MINLVYRDIALKIFPVTRRMKDEGMKDKAIMSSLGSLRYLLTVGYKDETKKDESLVS